MSHCKLTPTKCWLAVAGQNKNGMNKGVASEEKIQKKIWKSSISNCNCYLVIFW